VCGIAGILSLDPALAPSEQALMAMRSALRHRGPDEAGLLLDGPVGLAVRRLAIVDPAHGHQPASDESGDIRVVLNGEIYGHRELARDLRGRGHALATRSDTELLAHLYEERGPDFVRGLRGMFALALWDARERRLLLARDPFGVKPLLIHRTGRRIAFASELRALLCLSDVPRDVDPDALETYLAMNAVLAPRTMVRGVEKLPAGHLLVAGEDGVRTVRYARPRPVSAGSERREPPAQLASELRARLRGSVGAHLDADVPVGVLLSGGLDSGAVLALAAEHAGPGVAAFTVGFEDSAFDELARAREVARRHRAEHHELVVRPADAAEHLASVARDQDEPRGDATALPYWLLARLAARHVKAALSGEGADELLGGYQTYAADRLPPLALSVAAAAAPLLRAVPASSGRLGLDYRIARLARGAGLGPVERHHAWKEIVPTPERRALVALAGASGDPLDAYRRRYAGSDGAEPVARLQDLDAGTFLADDLLLQADRMGMAHGLEIRVPYLDPVVAELALALRADDRVRGLRTKVLLRRAMRADLPRAVVEGEKRGFVAPAARWLRGPLLPLARELLAPAVLARQGLVRPAAAAAMLERHLARRENLSRPLWALIALTLWHDEVLRAPRTRHEPLCSGGAGVLAEHAQAGAHVR
jgi:asparagine synthase (glutamine-hydrolysing)